MTVQNPERDGFASIARPIGDSPHALLRDLWQGTGLSDEALSQVSIAGEPILPSVFRVADVAAASTAAAALAAAEVARLRGGERLPVKVDVAHAEVAYRSERYLELEGDWADPFNPFWGYYRTADDRYVQLHTSFPHHLEGALRLLDVPPDPDRARAAVATWDAQSLEDALYDNGLPGSMLRTREEWLAHPHGRAVSAMPLMEILPLGDAPPATMRHSDRPLDGLRVLDLTRVIAGPVCGRTLADYGADVLRIQGPHIPYIALLAIDTGRGKRMSYLDLRDAGHRADFERLLRGCDVFVQGYRPGTIAQRGYTPEAVAALRPGVIYVSVSAYSDEGPWGDRRGFDSLVQIASGIAAAGARSLGRSEPFPLPCQALDHTVGYLAAFGAMVALTRRMTIGGSWHVKISLAQAGEWLQRLGHIDGLGRVEPDAALIAPYLMHRDSWTGAMTCVAPVCPLGSPTLSDPVANPMRPSDPRWRGE